MNNFFDYITWRGDLSFNQSAFNDVDAGILSRLVYEPFDNFVSSDFKTSARVGDVCEQILGLEELSSKVIYLKLDSELMNLVKNSKRFGDIRITGFVNEVDEETECQFAACVFDLGKNNYFLAYRGTDKNLVGWKEDLNMGVCFPVPAQLRAVEYYEQAASSLPEGKYIIGGHSKGGNLAIYSAAFSNSQCQNMVSRIYNFDGPGFNDDVMQMLEYQAVEPKVITYVPQFSVVGMILEHSEDYSVVKSNNPGILQHEILSWGVNHSSFTTLKHVTKGSKFVDNTLKNWLAGLNEQDRSDFIEAVYDILSSGGNSSVAEDLITPESVMGMFKSFTTMDSKLRNKMMKVFLKLGKSAGSTMYETSSNTVNDRLKKISRRRKS